MKNKFRIIAAISIVLFYFGCKKMEVQMDSYSQTPILPATVYNYDNSFNDNLATLGRVLFYDKKMSLNNSISCGSCHQQSKAFCDNKQFSTGLQDGLTRRNTPTIVLHGGDLFWDGRAANFHDLALMPLVNHVEMKNYDISKLENKIANISYYPALFNSAFGNNEVTIDKIQQAIGEFLYNFNFTKNKNQDVEHGLTSFNAEEQIGRDLFWGKAQCINCHAGASFSGWSGGGECIGLDESYTDNGIGELTKDPADNAKFRIPTLLNIEFTAPYMHDGRFKTLEEVVEHYNSGIKQHPNLSWALKSFSQFENMSSMEIQLLLDVNHDGIITDDEIPPGTPLKLNLTDLEKKSLVAFLKTLSDHTVYTDSRFSDPFKIN